MSTHPSGPLTVLCCGDRNWTDRKIIRTVLGSIAKRIDVVIEGEARGADRICCQEAEALGLRVEKFPADWDGEGRRAGILRNIQMLDCGPNLVLAFHDHLETSEGTGHTVRTALSRGIMVLLVQSNGKITKC